MNLLICISAFLSVCLYTAVVRAFPEMVRHGYNNCITCHISPSGGGVLSSYGRQISRESLSFAGSEGEEQFLYGLFSTPEWLAAGGDFRGLQFYRDSATTRSANVIGMQDDLEAAVIAGKWVIDATLGQQANPTGPPAQNTLYSRRYFLNFKPTEQISFRVGKFLPTYGINTPDHVISIKRGLGWDENSETYNAEAAWLGDDVDIYVTGIWGRPDYTSLQREKGYAVQSGVYLAEKYKVGASYYYGYNDTQTRILYGPWGILGFTPHFFLLAELDFQTTSPNTTNVGVNGGVDYLKLDYEFLQGIHFFVTQEMIQTNSNDSNTLSRTYGAGFQFFPRPHFEFQVVWQKQQIVALSGGYYDFAYLMAHFYP